MFNLFRKKSITWNNLSTEQKKIVTKNISKHIKALSGAKYRIVQGDDVYQRERPIVEHENEDQILTSFRRNRLLDLTRNAVRNSSTFNAILKQFDYNVCGTKAGKVICNFKDLDLARDLVDSFRPFTRSADFFDGVNFNQLLKLILKNQLIGGDCVIMFDDGRVENSGKLLVYEADEIMNTTPEAIKANYGENATQSQGKIYNENGRWIGTVVSRGCRGQEVADPMKCYFLHRDPDANQLESFWIQPANIWRVCQGRGITQSASSLATILDCEDLVGFELAKAKKASQTFAQIINTDTKERDNEQLPSTFDDDTDFSSMTDEEIEQAVNNEKENDSTQTVSLEAARSAGIIYAQMPDNYKMEALSTNSPNENVIDFVKWLAGRSSAAFGLSEAYATLMPTTADFRAHQLLSQPAFNEAQKQLEQICDWALFQYINWLGKNNKFDCSRLPENWMKFISWSWVKLDEIDEVQHQSAVEKKIRNCTGTLREELGNDWREKLLEIKEEIDFCEANNIPHPAFNLKSGGERTELKNYN